MRVWRAVVTLALWLAANGVAHAHATGASYLDLRPQRGEAGFSGRWDIPATDLQAALELDGDGDGLASAAEVFAARARIERFALARLSVERGGEPCRLASNAITTSSRDAQTYVSLALRGACAAGGAFTVQSQLFFGSPGYSLLVDVASGHGSVPGVLTLASAAWHEPANTSWLATLGHFIGAGVWHVLIGYDHIAFLVLLLLPGVLRKTASGWATATSLRVVLADVLRIVTAFTAAHSITLGLAASGTVTLPVRPVELAIAGSIVVAGLLNLSTAAARGRIALAFGFGLVHGFGFANALAEMPAGGVRLAPMLAGFNLGVEIAQLMIVALMLPLLWRLSRRPQYGRWYMPAMSLATAVTGAFWFVGRW